MQPTFVSGWGAYHPPTAFTNDQLVGELDTSHEWLESRIGIRERRIADGETVAHMGALAVDAALKCAGAEVADLDLIIGAGSFDDHEMPSSASRIAEELGSDAFTFDVEAACSGWLVGLDVAAALIAAGRARTVAVCSSELTTPWIDPSDRTTKPFFGDAAGATIVTADRPTSGLEILEVTWRADNTEAATVHRPSGGYFRMDGPRTRRWVEAAVLETSVDLLGRHGLRAADLRGLVCHQANLRLIESLAASLGVAPEHHWHNVEWAGNTSATGAVSSLALGLDEAADELSDGDPVLVVTVGAGLNVVAALARWVSDREGR